MSIDALQSLIPAYSQDLSRNLTVLLSETVLNTQQKWGTFLASAHAIGVPQVVQNFEAAAVLTPEAVKAAKTASAIMAMNNVYYRALHLMENREYQTLRSGLRMNLLTNPGVDKLDFELWCFAVSAINGCAVCMDSHEKVLRDHDISDVQVQTALRIAATVNAISAVIRAENALMAT
jgi:lipoyl-dependent peroxiredoxin subunit D